MRYGDQISNSAVQGVKPEAVIRIRLQPVHGRFADGARYTLQKPSYSISRLNYGPLTSGVMVSPRVAPQMTGVGLLEAISSADILDNAARQAAASGPINDRLNRSTDSAVASPRAIRSSQWRTPLMMAAATYGWVLKGAER